MPAIKINNLCVNQGSSEVRAGKPMPGCKVRNKGDSDLLRLCRNNMETRLTNVKQTTFSEEGIKRSYFQPPSRPNPSLALLVWAVV
eukprot:1486109-Amphidinium_carterae.1